MRKVILFPLFLCLLISCQREAEVFEEQELKLDLTNLSIDLGEDFFVSTYNLEDEDLNVLIDELASELYDIDGEDLGSEGYVGFDLVIEDSKMTVKAINGIATTEDEVNVKTWTHLGLFSNSKNLANKIKETLNEKESSISIQVKRNTLNTSLFIG